MTGAPDKKAVEAGTILSGRYRLDELLGAGGMGRVFRGYHLELKVPIAIKVMHEVLAHDPELSRRFEREARAAMMLSHPNVVRVLDLGHEGETKFIVMEYIEGSSLGDVIESYPAAHMPIDVIVDALAQTADALAAAHEKGLVHRDLKPDNIIASKSGGLSVYRVLDFGLVKMTGPEAGATLTQADQVAGTPAYMSPEQCRSLAVGPSADLYSLGCILHEMLGGQPPFSGASAIEIIARQMYLPPPAVDRAPGTEPVPADLEALRKELLRKTPEERPEDAASIAARLRGCRSAGPGAATSAAARGSRPPRGALFPKQVETEVALPAAGTALSMAVLRLAAAHPLPGLGDDLIVALGAQGLQATVVERIEDLSAVHADLVVVDGGADVAATADAMREIARRVKDLPRLAVLSSFSNEDLSQLIEAGAGDVARGSLGAEVLAKRALRLARRRRR